MSSYNQFSQLQGKYTLQNKNTPRKDAIYNTIYLQTIIGYIQSERILLVSILINSEYVCSDLDIASEQCHHDHV